LRKQIITGPAFVFQDAHDSYYALREGVGTLLGTHPANVRIVGSAKLGFSIAPYKRYRHFGDKSDVDVMVVDERLFDTIWGEIFDATEQDILWPKRTDFARYLMEGWIRPDMFPSIKGKLIGSWWDGFREQSQSVGVKVTGAVYRNWEFLERYQLTALRQCVALEQTSK
jgi:hypothetical protein